MATQPILRAVKRLVGASAPGPLELAREKHAAARKVCDEVEAAQNDAVRLAREAFEQEGTEASADTLARIERRAQIMIEAARLKMSQAWTAVEKAEGDAKAERIGELDQVVATTSQRAVALAEKALPHLRALLEVTKELDGIVQGSVQAAREAGALKGERKELTFARQAGVQAAPRVLRAALLEALGFRDREAIMALLESGPQDLGGSAA